MHRIILLLLLLSGSSFGLCPTLTIPTDYLTVDYFRRANQQANWTAVANAYNNCKDSINAGPLLRINNWTTNLQIKSLQDMSFKIDDDNNGTHKLVFLGGAADTLAKFTEDTTARFYKNVTVNRSVTVDSNISATGGYFYNPGLAKPSYTIGSAGSNYGHIGNINSTTWGLGSGASRTALSTSALTWNDAGAVTLSGAVAIAGVATASGGIVLGASFTDKTTTLSSNTTLTTAHSTIFASASGGGFTLTLPAAAGLTGLTYTIYKVDVTAAATGGGNTVTIDGNASETIGGAANQVLASNLGNGALRIICDGSNWKILSLYDEGSFIVTATGFTVNPTGTAVYSRNGKQVTVMLPTSFTGASNLPTFTATGSPASIAPTVSTQIRLAGFYNNSAGADNVNVFLSAGSTTYTFMLGEITNTWATALTTKGTTGNYTAQSFTYTLF